MSDENPPVAPAAPADPPPAAPPVAATPPAPEGEPHWLKPRLEQAERAAEKRLLDSLGLKDPAEVKQAKEALEAARKRAEADKTLEQRLAEIESQNKAVMTEAERYKATTTEHAARMMGALKPEHQEAVKALSGDDPVLQLKAIATLGPTWAAQAAADPKPPPANTLPPKDAPGETAPGSPPDPVAQYQAMQQTNPFRAAAYGLSNPAVYTPKS